MTERERLIELLQSWGNQENDGVRAESIADYLLANGVQPLPFKINDIVYGVSRRRQIIPIQIDTIQYTIKGINMFGGNEEYFGYGLIHLDINNQIGMKWYRTKEEAEQALREEQDHD